MGRTTLISRNLPPLTGGIERLMRHVVAELSVAGPCDVIGPAGCGSHLPGAGRVLECPPGVPWFHLSALRHIRALPQSACVLAGNGVTAPLAALAARRSRCAYGVFVHGLDLVVDNAAYQAMFLPFIRRAAIVIANSAHVAGLAATRSIAREKIRVLNPGVSVPLAVADGASFRARLGIGDRPMLLSAGRLVPRKGIAEFVERALPRVLRAVPDACYVVVGQEPQQAIGARSSVSAQVQAAAIRAGFPAAVRLVGSVSDEELAGAYAAADVFVFPVLDLPGDVEGFGMVALEAAAQGTPTVAYRVGGVPDAVSARNGWLIAPGDEVKFADTVIAALQGTRPDAEACRAHAREHDWASFGERLRAIVKELGG